jgi:hypothetical protein
MHSTNYFNTLIEIAEDSTTPYGQVPPSKAGKRSIVNLQYELLADRPYQLTSDDLLFAVFAARNNLPEAESAEQRKRFFSKGQACLRSSPLTKRYGWGIHSDAEGKLALYGVDSAAYQRLVADETVAKTKAMRSKRA